MTKMMMSHLPRDLVEEILSRVPITCLTAVRSTCKGWNNLSKDESFTKKHCGKAAKEFLMIMTRRVRLCLMSINLHGIHNHVDPFMKKIGMKKIGNLLNQVQIYKAIHSNGLLLCVTRDKPSAPNVRLLVWNPYLGQMKWIQPRYCYDLCDNFAIGYDKRNNNHKILRFWIRSELYSNDRSGRFKIYNLKSNSWRALDVTPKNWSIREDSGYQRCITLKGNAYFVAHACIGEYHEEQFVHCFDFTKERFGPRLHLPFDFDVKMRDYVTLSSVREEQLTVLHRDWYTYEMTIWVTTKIEPNEVSWEKFFVLEDDDMGYIAASCQNFFIDEEKKVVVVWTKKDNDKTSAYMIKEDGYYKEVDLGESEHYPHVCFYVPSLVQIPQDPVPARGKRKKRDY